jgi:hypothetical protein
MAFYLPLEYLSKNDFMSVSIWDREYVCVQEGVCMCVRMCVRESEINPWISFSNVNLVFCVCMWTSFLGNRWLCTLARWQNESLSKRRNKNCNKTENHGLGIRTVKSVHNHPLEPKIVVIVYLWLLFKVSISCWCGLNTINTIKLTKKQSFIIKHKIGFRLQECFYSSLTK